MPVPRYTNLSASRYPEISGAARARLSVSEIPTTNKNSDAVANAKYRQNPSDTLTGKIWKKVRSYTVWKMIIMRMAIPRTRSISPYRTTSPIPEVSVVVLICVWNDERTKIIPFFYRQLRCLALLVTTYLLDIISDFVAAACHSAGCNMRKIRNIP